MQDILGTLDKLVWNYALIGACLGAGLFFSLLTRFV